MGRRTLVCAFAALFILSNCCAQINLVEDRPATSEPIPLTVRPGAPLHIELTKAVPVKRAGVPVEGLVVEDIYVYDHLVIPAGSRVLGRVTQVDGSSRKRRALAIANGNFSPLRKAYVDFDTLVFKDGTRIPLKTAVSQGAPSIVHVTAGAEDRKKKGRVSEAVGQARQQAKVREQDTLKEITAPGKLDRLKSALAAKLPYHRPSLRAGTSFTAELKAPVQLGMEQSPPKVLAARAVGGAIPPGSIVHVRLLTSLSSATAHRGSPVRAVVSEPLFASNHSLIIPEGTRLEGDITQAVPARRLGRNGRLRFMFRQIDLTPGAPRAVEASLQAINAASAAHMELDSEGGAHAVTPKTHYIMPAIDVFLAATSFDLDADRRGVEAGAAGGGAEVGGGLVKGGVGFGLVGSVIGLLARSRPVNAGFAFYGAGWAVYSHVVARGVDVVFPKNTPMEIRFGTHESASSTAPKG